MAKRVPVDFIDYDPLAAGNDDDGVGTVTVRCTRGSGLRIDLGNGANFSGTRRMTNGTDFLGYALYTDAGRATAWGSGAGSGLAIAPAANFAAQNYSVYGRIPAGQDVSVGVYNDTVVATINY